MCKLLKNMFKNITKDAKLLQFLILPLGNTAVVREYKDLQIFTS